MASIVESSSPNRIEAKILSESALNDLKRKQVEKLSDENLIKKARIADENGREVAANGDHANGDETAIDLSKVAAAPKVDSSNTDSSKTDLSKTDSSKTESSNAMDVEEELITPEDIRKLKELLRQEEAKLQLIKR
jgi:hypothetical protein